jgi:hypothetical protein
MAERIVSAGTTPAHRPNGRLTAGNTAHRAAKARGKEAAAPTADPAAVAASLRGELQISSFPDYWFSFTGTAQQLIDEGLVPADFQFPDGWQEVKRPNLRDFVQVTLVRQRLPRTGASKALVDNWTVTGWIEDRRERGENWRVREAARLLAEHEFVNSPAWNLQWKRYFKAQDDRAFHKAMNLKALVRATKAAL